jgi:hypothetical protein
MIRGRIRTYKPDIFLDEELWEAGETTGWPIYQGFQGLWSFSDREGRFEWRPRALKTQILPYWSGDFEALLDALVRFGFIVKYEANGRFYGWVKSLKEHQKFHANEPPSKLPGPPSDRLVANDRSLDHHADPLDQNGPQEGEGKGRELEGNGSGRGSADTTPPVTEIRQVAPEPTGTTQPTWNALGRDYVAPTELEDEAVMRNVSREYFRERVKRARNKPIGGRDGVFSREDWIRDQLGFWAMDEQSAKARAGPRRSGSAQKDHGVDPFANLKEV